MSQLSRQPNFLFLFPDQWRWDWLGCEESPYGKVPVRTPNIDALARRGVRFTQCRTNSPLCSPARACLALGKRCHRTGVPNNSFDLPPEPTTVFNLLRDAGYRTLTCGKNDLHKKTVWKGVDGWTQLLGQYGFTDAIDHSGKLDAANNGHEKPNCSYTSLLHSVGLMDEYVEDYKRRHEEASGMTAPWPSPLPRKYYTDEVCSERAMDLLDRLPQEGPWMLWVNWPGPHDPMDPPRELQQRYDGMAFPDPVDGAPTFKNDSAVDHQQIRRNYAAECEGIDEGIGRLLDKVARRGELDNTVVVFASDHGEMLGDHGRFSKHVAKEGSVHVPLIISGPGVADDLHGTTSDAMVELIDLAPTFLDLAGLPTPSDWDGRSVGPILRGEAGASDAHRDVQISQLSLWRMIFDGRYKRVVIDEAPEGPHRVNKDAWGQTDALFDLQEDPFERVNRIDDLPEIAARLRERLDAETVPIHTLSFTN